MGFPNYRRQNALFKYVALFGFAALYPYVRVPITTFFFRQVTDAKALEEHMANLEHGRARYQCSASTGDWEYVCDVYRTGPKGTLKAERVGFTIGPWGPNGAWTFPGDMTLPVPTRAQIERFRGEDLRFYKLIDINGGESDLVKLPGIDEMLARRIFAASQRSPFVVPEDILRVEGMDQGKLDHIRPMIRVGFKGRPRFEDFVRPGASSN